MLVQVSAILKCQCNIVLLESLAWLFFPWTLKSLFSQRWLWRLSKRLRNNFHSSQQQWSASSFQAVAGFLWIMTSWRISTLLLSCSFLLHQLASWPRADKVIKTALYADVLFVLFPLLVSVFTCSCFRTTELADCLGTLLQECLTGACKLFEEQWPWKLWEIWENLSA